MRRAVAALVQPVARGVYAEGDAILHYRELDLIQRACLREPLKTVGALEPLDHGFLDYLLAVGNGEELGVETVTLDGESAVLRDDGLPRQSLCALEQLVKRESVEPAHFDKHALADAQADIGAGKRFIPAGEVHAAVLGRDAGHVHSLQFIGYWPLKPKKAGDAEFIFHNCS